MTCCRSMRLASVAAILVFMATTTPALAIGYWNVPGNSCQWWGCGWGAGHHACLMLGPSSCSDAFNHREVRLPHSPRPPYCYNGCGAYNYDFRQVPAIAPAVYEQSPHEIMPVTAPQLVPETLPELAPVAPADAEPPADPLPTPEEPMSARPLFDAPVER